MAMTDLYGDSLVIKCSKCQTFFLRQSRETKTCQGRLNNDVSLSPTEKIKKEKEKIFLNNFYR